MKFIDKSNNPSTPYDDKTTYEYSASGKLIERTHLTTKGMIWDVNTYEPTTEGKIQIATKVNSGINFHRGELNELSLFGNTLYEYTNEALSWGMKTFQRYYGNNQDSPTLRTRLGFDPKGQLVWEEGIYLNGVSSTTLSYKLYRRDLAGNAIFIRSVGDGYTTYPTEQVLTYDDKPNPYRTTGDILPSEATNPNNILTQQTVEKGVVTTFRYAYEYRPDGYPRLAKTYKNGELISTREFKYNQ